MKKQRLRVRHFVQTSTILCALFAAIVCAACGTVPQSSALADTPTSTFAASPSATIPATASPSVTPSATTTPPVTTPTNTPVPTATSSTGSASAMATSYYQALEQQNYTLAYSFLDPKAIITTTNQNVTPEVFTALAQSTDSNEGDITAFSVGAFPPLVVMTVTRKYGPYHAHLQVKLEGSTWKIISLDRI